MSESVSESVMIRIRIRIRVRIRVRVSIRIRTYYSPSVLGIRLGVKNSLEVDNSHNVQKCTRWAVIYSKHLQFVIYLFIYLYKYTFFGDG